MRPYELIINEEACWGCKTCEVACKQENNAPTGVQLISIRENGALVSPEKRDFIFQINVCRHCVDSPCVEACTEGAIFRRDDGIVILQTDQCTGCRICLNACPHDAIAFDEGNGIAQKCNLCYERLDKGLLPACADNVCLAHCIRLN